MSAAEEPRKDDNSEEISEVKAVGGGVEAAVNSQGRALSGRADGPERVAGERFKEAPLFKDFNHIGIGIGIGIRLRRPEKLLGSRRR